LREAALIKSRLPAHNQALRRKSDAGVVELVDGLPTYVPAAGIECERLPGSYGPFVSRASVRAALRELAAQHQLCWRRLQLERRSAGPCFARQLKRCNGVCVDEEAPQVHDHRLASAFAKFAIPPWPLRGAALVREVATHGGRVDVHVIRNWCWLGTARDEGELAALAAAPVPPAFDLDVTRLLLRRHRAGALALIPMAPTADTEGIAAAADY
jgi:DNA polymerase-3 subunit epsilon